MDRLWWKSVPNPAGMIQQITDAMRSGEQVACVIPEQLAWLDTFRSEIAAECQDSQRTVRYIDAQQRQDKSPGELILTEVITHPTLAEGYRRSIGYARYLADTAEISGLGNYYILVRNARGETLRAWNRFIADYRKACKAGQPSCIFLLECIDERPESGCGLKIVDYYSCIKPFDSMIFCMLASSALDLPPLIKNYAVALAAELGKHDPELAAALIRDGEMLVQDPADFRENAIPYLQRSDGTEFAPDDRVKERIWRAQIKVFFPVIEEYRMQLIKRFESEMPLHETIVGTFGQVVDDICDIDLGTFKSLCDMQKMHIPQTDYTELCFYRDCRNDLAHANLIEYERLHRLCLNR